jgi:nucleotide-binding universal stress UspA family protein
MTNTDLGSIPARDEPASEHIVVGVDGHPTAAKALRWAAQQCRLTGRALRVVHAWQMTELEAASVSTELWEAASAHTRARATGWVVAALGGAQDVRMTLAIVEGPPGPVLVERARDAALLVVGAREHTGLRRVVHGSVSHYCLAHSVVPVVAVPAVEDSATASAGAIEAPVAAGSAS